MVNSDKELDIVYGHDLLRKKTMQYEGGSLVKTKYFMGNYEIEIDSNGVYRHLNYISAADGLFAIHEEKDGQENMYYVHKDHLGSFYAITDEDKTVVERLSFDPWGRRRNPTNWTFDNVPTTFLFDRGFTGHEHLDGFGLINMNGRVYDPTLARFLSPDPFLENLNRYSYVFNNPLKHTDPTGYSTYWDEMTKRYDYEGGSFYYRGSYYNYDSYSGLFFDEYGNCGGGSGYYYENGGYVYNGQPTSFSDVYYNFIMPNAYMSLSGEKAVSFFSGLQDGYSIYSYNLFGRTCLVLSDGDPGLYGGDNIGYKAMNPTAGSYLTEVIINGKTNGDIYNYANLTLNGINTLAYVINTRQIPDLLQLGNAPGPKFTKRVNFASKGLTRIGVGASIFSAGISIYRYSQIKNPTWGDKTELGIGITSAVLSAIPYTTYAGIGMGLIDVVGGFNELYNFMDMNEQLYNSSGTVIIPNMNGIFIPLKLK